MIYKRTACALLLFAALCLAFPVTGWTIGMEVDPVEINLSNCPLGERIAISELGGEKMKLRIENKSDSACTYTINILTHANAPLKKDYRNIPDTSWLWPEKREVRIPGKSTKTVELYLKIPKAKEYYDKKYQAIVEVKSKKNNPQDLFVLAVQIRISFSTNKAEVLK